MAAGGCRGNDQPQCGSVDVGRVLQIRKSLKGLLMLVLLVGSPGTLRLVHPEDKPHQQTNVVHSVQNVQIRPNGCWTDPGETTPRDRIQLSISNMCQRFICPGVAVPHQGPEEISQTTRTPRTWRVGMCVSVDLDNVPDGEGSLDQWSPLSWTRPPDGGHLLSVLLTSKDKLNSVLEWQ